jgi:hypothetical protein
VVSSVLYVGQNEGAIIMAGNFLEKGEDERTCAMIQSFVNGFCAASEKLILYMICSSVSCVQKNSAFELPMFIATAVKPVIILRMIE